MIKLHDTLKGNMKKNIFDVFPGIQIFDEAPVVVKNPFSGVGFTLSPEEVAVYGRDLAVVGPGFRGGTGWFSFELPAADPSDVLDVRGVDVTGDARSEVLVRVRQSLGDVQREVLLVFELRGDVFPLLLAREVAARSLR